MLTGVLCRDTACSQVVHGHPALRHFSRQVVGLLNDLFQFVFVSTHAPISEIIEINLLIGFLSRSTFSCVTVVIKKMGLKAIMVRFFSSGKGPTYSCCSASNWFINSCTATGKVLRAYAKNVPIISMQNYWKSMEILKHGSSVHECKTWQLFNF